VVAVLLTPVADIPQSGAEEVEDPSGCPGALGSLIAIHILPAAALFIGDTRGTAVARTLHNSRSKRLSECWQRFITPTDTRANLGRGSGLWLHRRGTLKAANHLPCIAPRALWNLGESCLTLRLRPATA